MTNWLTNLSSMINAQATAFKSDIQNIEKTQGQQDKYINKRFEELEIRIFELHQALSTEISQNFEKHQQNILTEDRIKQLNQEALSDVHNQLK